MKLLSALPATAVLAMLMSLTLEEPSRASATPRTAASSVAVRVTQVHAQLPAGPEARALVFVRGVPGTRFEVFLSRDGHTKDLVLGDNVVPLYGSIGWSPGSAPDHPRMFLCTQADTALYSCQIFLW
jgi:hypothetical protein